MRDLERIPIIQRKISGDLFVFLSIFFIKYGTIGHIMSTKAKISKEIVQHTAALARIALDEKEITLFQKQLAQIISFFEQVQELETGGIDPYVHVNDALENVLREDIPTDSLSLEEAVSQSHMRSDDYFKVPKVLE